MFSIKLILLLTIGVSMSVADGIELEEDSNRIIIDTLVYAVKHINTNPFRTLHVSFSSINNQRVYQQADIINGFLLKSDLDLVVRLDDIGGTKNIPTERRRFTMLLIDSTDSFQAIDSLLTSRQYHTDGKHLIIISRTLEDDDARILIQNVFDKLFARYIVNVELLVRNKTTGLVEFYAFFPVSRTFCFQIVPVKHNTFDGFRSVEPLNLFPRKFENFFGCPLVLTTFDFPPHVFMSRENGKVKVRGLDVSILYGIADKLNFTVDVIDTGTRGIMLPNGTLTGSLFVLKSAQANITLGGFGSSSKAMLQFTPSVAYLSTSMVFAIPPLREYSPLEKLILPFGYDVWIAIGITFGITFLTSIVLEIWKKPWRDLVFGDSVKDPVFEMIIVYLGGAVVRFPKGALARNVILQWLIASLILSSCYKAVLFGMLKTGFLKRYPATIEGMLDLGYVIDVPLPLLQNMKDGPLGKRKSAFHLLEHSLHTHYAIIQTGDTKRMVIDTRIQLAYFNTINYQKMGILSHLPQRLFLFPMYIYYRKDSYLVQPFDRIINTFIESGIIGYWRNLLINVNSLNPIPMSSEAKPLYLKDLQSCIAICDILLSVSILIFLLEVLSTRNKLVMKLFLMLKGKRKSVRRGR